MTTLDVHMDQLRSAVAPYPVVKDLRVSTQFPHGMTDPRDRAAAGRGGRRRRPSDRGRRRRHAAARRRSRQRSLPLIPLRVAARRPAADRSATRSALSRCSRAAPYPVARRVSQVITVASHGLVAQVRGGPSIYFGDARAPGREVGGRGRGARRPRLSRRPVHRRHRSGAAGRRGRIGGVERLELVGVLLRRRRSERLEHLGRKLDRHERLGDRRRPGVGFDDAGCEAKPQTRALP